MTIRFSNNLSSPAPVLHAPTLVWRRSYVSSITISRTDREGLLIYRQTCVIISFHGYESYFLFLLPEMMGFLFMKSCHCLYPSRDFDFDCEATQTLAGFRLKFLVVQLNWRRLWPKLSYLQTAVHVSWEMNRLVQKGDKSAIPSPHRNVLPQIQQNFRTPGLQIVKRKLNKRPTVCKI